MDLKFPKINECRVGMEVTYHPFKNLYTSSNNFG